MLQQGENCAANPPLHFAFMDKYQLWRDAMPLWLQEAGHFDLPPDANRALQLYMGPSFEAIWKYYDISPTDISPTALNCPPETFVAFDSLWKLPGVGKHVFSDMILFEGQGCNEMDLLAAKQGDKFLRKRPTSTTWSLNAATWFAGKELIGLICVHHVRDPNVIALLAQECGTRSFGNAWNECEIILQPGLEITVDSETIDTLDSYERARSEVIQYTPRPVRILHTSIRVSTDIVSNRTNNV